MSLAMDVIGCSQLWIGSQQEIHKFFCPKNDHCEHLRSHIFDNPQWIDPTLLKSSTLPSDLQLKSPKSSD